MSGDLSGFSMFDLFREEARTHGDTISRGLVELESNPQDANLIASLMRAAHSLKGAAKIVGLDLAVAVAHAMEDAMVAVQKGDAVVTASRIDHLLAAADLLAQLTDLTEDAIDDWMMSNVARADSVVTDLRSPVQDSALESPIDTRPEKFEMSSTISDQSEDGTIKVASARLDHIMRLAGESLVASRRFESVRNQLIQIRKRHASMQARLRQSRVEDPDTSQSALDAAKKDAVRTEIELAEHQDQLDVFIGQLEVVADSLYSEVLGSRMRPFDEGIAMFPRLVRDLSRSLGKEASLVIEGSDVPVDRDVLRELEAPLTHMLRNCVDHGIESPDERVRSGKSLKATVTLSARHHSGHLEVVVSDDGRGIDPEIIRDKVMARGLASSEVASALTNRELYEFLFLPGFSTAHEITDVSGRGVGLDVVQTMIQNLSGGIRIDSEPGSGTSFQLTLPLTRSVVRALIADIGSESYAFPMTQINQIKRFDASDVVQENSRPSIELDDRTVEMLDCGSILELGPIRSEQHVHAVIAGNQEELYAFCVDGFLGEEDLLVRPLDQRLGRVPHVASTAFLESGEPTIVLDVEDLIRTARRGVAEGAFESDSVKHSTEDDETRILVVDDSITVREAQRSILMRHGYVVDLAIDGAEGWERLQRSDYDLLITDVDMPGMNGIELVRTLRANPRYQNLPVAIVSYKDDDQQRQQGIDAGGDAYLSKHVINDDQFIDTIRTLLKTGREVRES